MTANARFHLDESVTIKIAHGLRKRDRDCTTPKEAGLLGASDQQHLDYCRDEGRVLVTRDTDFLILASENVTHAGIIFWGSRQHFGQLIRQIDELATDRPAHQWKQAVVFV
jgi:hypothetical protein